MRCEQKCEGGKTESRLDHGKARRGASGTRKHTPGSVVGERNRILPPSIPFPFLPPFPCGILLICHKNSKMGQFALETSSLMLIDLNGSALENISLCFHFLWSEYLVIPWSHYILHRLYYIVYIPLISPLLFILFIHLFYFYYYFFNNEMKLYGVGNALSRNLRNNMSMPHSSF